MLVLKDIQGLNLRTRWNLKKIDFFNSSKIVMNNIFYTIVVFLV